MARNKSILIEDMDHCVICGRERTAIHHVFEGKNRKLSDEDGLIIPLCFVHHNGSNDAIHFNKILDLSWKGMAQEKYEETHTREEFIQRYGRSYL